MNDISIHLTVHTQKAINVKHMLETMVFGIMTKLVENLFTSQGRNKMAYHFTDTNTIPGRAEIVHKFFSRPRPRGRSCSADNYLSNGISGAPKFFVVTEISAIQNFKFCIHAVSRKSRPVKG